MRSSEKEWGSGVKSAVLLYGPRLLKVLIPAAVLIFIYWEGKEQLHRLHPAVALHLVERLAWWKMCVLALSGLAAVLMMTGYDWVLVSKAGISLKEKKGSYLRIIRISWIANTFNNVLGFAGFTGAGLRLLLYKKEGASVSALLRYLLFLSLSMVTGLSFFAWFAALGWFPVGALFGEYRWLHAAVWLTALYLPLYLLICGTPFGLGRWLKLEGKADLRTVMYMVSASVAEWLSAGLMFALTANIVGLHLTAAGAMGMFSLAAIAGILSMAPGGMGTFDLVILISMGTYGVEPDQALAVLLIFRVFYYLLPWTIGLFLAATEWAPSKETLLAVSQGLYDKSLTRWQRFWSWPSQIRMVSNFGIWALAALVFLSGGILLLSAATPGVLERMRLLNIWITPYTMKLSHQISVFVSIVLIVLSRGIHLRVKRAYQLSLVMLAAGAVFALMKGLDYEEAIFLSSVAVLLYLSRERFYRQNVNYGKGLLLVWFGISVLMAGFYMAVADWTHMMPKHWLEHPERHRFLLKPKEFYRSAVVALAGTWLFLSAWAGLRPKRPVVLPPDKDDLDRLENLLRRYPGNMLTHLAFLGDKVFFWSKEYGVLLPYTRYRNSLIALGDPIGDESKFRAAIGQFREFADRYAMTPVFYQITTRYMPLYHEYGCRFFKLGEEGLVDLDAFTLTGRSKADLRAVRNRFEREGFRFEVIEPPFSEELTAELKQVSDEWLGGRKEKSFSLGWFEAGYLEKAPVAVVRTADGLPAAFASIMPCYDGGRTLSVDLMRFSKLAGNGIMDYMFLQLFEWGKAAGYSRFNMGMAPLSSVGEEPYAFREERVANWIFRNANIWYRFQGIRRFKEKFGPEWEPRFLAYPQNGSLIMAIMDAALRISQRPGTRN